MHTTTECSRILMAAPVKNHAHEPDALRENLAARAGVDRFRNVGKPASELVPAFLREYPEGNSYDLEGWLMRLPIEAVA
jgi:hypothetical protein